MCEKMYLVLIFRVVFNGATTDCFQHSYVFPLNVKQFKSDKLLVKNKSKFKYCFFCKLSSLSYYLLGDVTLLKVD